MDKMTLDEIFIAIKDNQVNILFTEPRYDKLGRRINTSKPGLVPIERFITKILINEITGCWEWQGAIGSKGYGQFRPHNSQPIKTGPHRFIYEYVNGEIPEDEEIDHDPCNNRICCFPDHLVSTTHQKNKKRSEKTKCVNGHKMVPENIYVSPKGVRYCKQCRSHWVNRRLKERLANDPEFREKRRKYVNDRQRSRYKASKNT